MTLSSLQNISVPSTASRSAWGVGPQSNGAVFPMSTPSKNCQSTQRNQWLLQDTGYIVSGFRTDHRLSGRYADTEVRFWKAQVKPSAVINTESANR
jgi:hypothetical protein